jgi:hypothetical protein
MNPNAARTTIDCPRCKQSIPARVEQLLDISADPGIKERLLSGKVNMVECPLCSFRGMATTPLVYHDPEKELLLTYTPVELNLPLPEKERMLGALTRAVLGRIPAEDRKGYLLQPKEMLSMEGLINAVLVGEGVTPEMIEQQRNKTKLLQKLAAATERELPGLITENDDQIDALFFQLLAALRTQSEGDKDSPVPPELGKLEQLLLQHSTFGQETRQQAEALQTAATELDALGKALTREKFVQLITAARDDHHVTSLVTLARPAADYQFFILLTEQIEKSTDEERKRLENIRTLVLETVQEIDAVAEERARVAAGVLQELLQAEDLPAAVKEHLPSIDQTLLMLMQHNIEAARKEKNEHAASRLEELRATIMQTMHESAPPEIRFVNELLEFETEEDAEQMIKRHAAELNAELLNSMKSAAEQLRAGSRPELADKLDRYRAVAEKEITAAKWR